MSQAKPMSEMRRLDNYGNVLAPRQARRYWHKLNRAEPGNYPLDYDVPLAELPKGHPTPRRADAITQRLARRRAAEAARA